MLVFTAFALSDFRILLNTGFALQIAFYNKLVLFIGVTIYYYYYWRQYGHVLLCYAIAVIKPFTLHTPPLISSTIILSFFIKLRST